MATTSMQSETWRILFGRKATEIKRQVCSVRLSKLIRGTRTSLGTTQDLYSAATTEVAWREFGKPSTRESPLILRAVDCFCFELRSAYSRGTPRRRWRAFNKRGRKEHKKWRSRRATHVVCT